MKLRLAEHSSASRRISIDRISKTKSVLRQNPDVFRHRHIVRDWQRPKKKVYLKQYGPNKTDSETELIESFNYREFLSLDAVFTFFITFCYVFVYHTHMFTMNINLNYTVRCEIPELENKFSFYEILVISNKGRVPYNGKYIGVQYCSYDVRNYTELFIRLKSYELLLEELEWENTTVFEKNRCNAFVVDTEVPFPFRTVRMFYQLFCEDEYFLGVIQFSILLGNIFSVLAGGFLGDIYGRKPVFIIASITQITGALLVFINYKWFYVIGQFLTGFEFLGLLSLGVLLTELNGRSTYVCYSILLCLTIPSSLVSVHWLSNKIYSWRYYHIIYCILLLSVPLIMYTVSESPKWLISLGHRKQAIEELRKNFDITNISSILLISTGVTDEKRQTFLNILKQINIGIFFHRFLINMTLFFLLSLMLAGEVNLFYLNNQDRELRKYSFFLTGVQAIFILGSSIAAYRAGRRKTLFSVCFVLSLYNVIYYAFDYQTNNIWEIINGLRVYFILVKIIQFLLLVYTAELYPTTIRMTTVCCCNAALKFGELLQSTLNVKHQHMVIDKTIRFCSSTIFLLLMCFLPETNNYGLPDKSREALYLKLYK